MIYHSTETGISRACEGGRQMALRFTGTTVSKSPIDDPRSPLLPEYAPKRYKKILYTLLYYYVIIIEAGTQVSRSARPLQSTKC